MDLIADQGAEGSSTSISQFREIQQKQETIIEKGFQPTQIDRVVTGDTGFL